VRSKLEKPPRVPDKYRRYRPQDWPGGWGEWAAEREKWAAAQEPVLISGTHHDGTPYACTATPLGDLTDLVRAAREARLTDFPEA
jgi:hypothetical protein